jgi:hypothetical protein
MARRAAEAEAVVAAAQPNGLFVIHVLVDSLQNHSWLDIFLASFGFCFCQGERPLISSFVHDSTVSAGSVDSTTNLIELSLQ